MPNTLCLRLFWHSPCKPKPRWLWWGCGRHHQANFGTQGSAILPSAKAPFESGRGTSIVRASTSALELYSCKRQTPQRLGSGPLLLLTLRKLPGAFREHSLNIIWAFWAAVRPGMPKECSKNASEMERPEAQKSEGPRSQPLWEFASSNAAGRVSTVFGPDRRPPKTRTGEALCRGKG